MELFHVVFAWVDQHAAEISRMFRCRRIVRMTLLSIAGVSVGGALVGCSGAGASEGSESARPASTARPRVASSASETYPGSGPEQLDFFDALESRELATHDDVLHAVLLLLKGSSAPTYVGRAAIAKQMGLLDAGDNSQPREAATIQDVSELLVRGMSEGGGGRANARGSLERLKELGVVPADWRAGRGISGPELLGILRRADRQRVASTPSVKEE